MKVFHEDVLWESLGIPELDLLGRFQVQTSEMSLCVRCLATDANIHIKVPREYGFV